MRFFNEKIVRVLDQYLADGQEYVQSVLLASYGLNIQFVNFSIQCNERVFASINGDDYEWANAPNSGPWGALGKQIASKVVLKSPSLLTIVFESGDSIDIETVENQYESVIFEFPSNGDVLSMEIF